MSDQTCKSSGVLATTAATSVCARPAKLNSVTLAPGSAACTLTVYDNAAGAASGTVIALVNGLANGLSVTLSFDAPVETLAGISYALTGAASQAIIYYQLM